MRLEKVTGRSCQAAGDCPKDAGGRIGSDIDSENNRTDSEEDSIIVNEKGMLLERIRFVNAISPSFIVDCHPLYPRQPFRISQEMMPMAVPLATPEEISTGK